MFEWFNNLPDTAKGTIIGAMLGASIAAIISLLAIGIKDFLFPILAENRLARKTRRETFKKYANPCILSSISLLYRLREILTNRGHFLLENSAKNDFHEYKYISTLYRLCSFIGWLRASGIELSYVEVKNSKQYREIQDAITLFEESLADGQHVEQSVLDHLSQLWHIDISSLSVDMKMKLGIDIENLLYQYCDKERVENTSQLSTNSKQELAISICNLICEKSKVPYIDKALINQKLDVFNKEVFRTSGLIYRDWQSAIGDMMIIKTPNESRKFEVIGFKDFEILYHSGNREDKKWIDRINKLFKNLDVTIEERFDSRTSQLKAVYKTTYSLLKSFSKIKTSNVDIASTNLKKLPSIID